MLYHKLLTAIEIIGVIFLAGFTSPVFAIGQYQTCNQSGPCVIGEFLYSDAGNPIATASCTLVSNTPTNTPFVNTALAGTADGYYSYSFTPTNANPMGTYPTTICCNTFENNICIDKTFSLTTIPSNLTSSDVESAVWNSTQANNLSKTDVNNAVWNDSESYGSVVSQVWQYNNRSLNVVGDLVSAIWNRFSTESNTTNSTTTAAAIANTDRLESEIKQSRELLEKLVNAPTVTTYLEEDPGPLIDNKLAKTNDMLTSITADIELLSTKVGTIVVNHTTMSDGEVIDELNGSLKIIQSANNQNSLQAKLKWFANAWPNPTADEFITTIETIIPELDSLTKQIQAGDRSDTLLSSLNSFFDSLTVIKTMVGNAASAESQATLYGTYKLAKARAVDLESQKNLVLGLQSSWNDTPEINRTDLLTKLKTKIKQINQVPGLEELTSTPEPKSALEDLYTLISINRSLLAKTSEGPLKASFLSNNRLIVRTLVHNPSLLVDQTATVKIILPKGLKLEDITKYDPRLSVAYDPAIDSVVASGSIPLAAGESELVDVGIRDIWQIDTAKLQAIKTEVESLIKPLENTSLYAQATSIKTTIFQGIDTVIDLTSKATGPTQRIEAWKQAEQIMIEVDQNLLTLRGLVSQTAQTSSLKGYVSGIQALTAWGIMLVFIGGFVFLTLYMRSLYSRPATAELTLPGDRVSLTEPVELPSFLDTVMKLPALNLKRQQFIIYLLILTSCTAALLLVKSISSGTIQTHSPKNPTLNQIEPKK